MSATRLLAVALFALVVAAPVRASTHTIHLHTDSTPDHATIEDFVATVTSPWTAPEDQATALFRAMSRAHHQSPTTFEDGASIWDPTRFYASYPNSFCGYFAAFFTAYVDAMGDPWRHRYVELGDHTVCEASWDAGVTWHMFDTSMVIFARNHEGSIASCADIAAADQCELSRFWGAPGDEPGHAYLYHADPSVMTNPPDPDHAGQLGYPSGYRKACDNPVPYSRTLRNGADSYTSGFDVQTAYSHVRTGWVNRLHLRPGHAYTRHWQALGSGADYARLDSQGEDPNDGAFPANIRSNGRWDIAPGFATADPAQGWHALANVVHRDQDGGGPGPRLRPATAEPAVLTVKIDAANVLTSARLYLDGRRGDGDAVQVDVSRDAGGSWSPAVTLPAGATAAWFDLGPGLVGGTFELLVRITVTPDATRQDCGLDGLRLEATTQLNRLALPRLQRGANRVRFASGPAHETLTIRPTLHLGAQHHWTVSADSHQGLTSRYDTQTYASAAVVPSVPGQPGTATWRVDAPTDIMGGRWGGSFITRRTGPGDRVDLRYSWDGVGFATAATFDGTSAATWDARLYATLPPAPAGQRSVWLQYRVVSTDEPSSASTGLQEILLEVHHQPHDAQLLPVAVTYDWTEHRPEGDVTRQHTRHLTGAADLYTINVAGHRDPTMNWVRVEPLSDAPAAGYSDGVDVGPGSGYDKVAITGQWLHDVALGRPYTVSRPAAAENPDTDGAELTDGTIIPPTTYRTSSLVQGQAAYWVGDDPLTVTVDLGSDQTIAAVRVTSHQPDATYGHAGTIAAQAIATGGAVTQLGVIQHDDVFSPTGDHLDWGFVQSERFADLPAGGRLAHGYWLVLDAPVTAREVRLDLLPLAGHGLGLSEIQVFSEVTVADWPDRAVDLGVVVGVPDGGGDPAPTPPAVTTRLGVAPNPANPGTVISYDVRRGGQVSLRLYDIRGRKVRELVDGWKAAGAHRAFWDGRDGAGRAVASGRYLAVFEEGGRRVRGAVTVVR